MAHTNVMDIEIDDLSMRIDDDSSCNTNTLPDASDNMDIEPILDNSYRLKERGGFLTITLHPKLGPEQTFVYYLNL